MADDLDPADSSSSPDLGRPINAIADFLQSSLGFGGAMDWVVNNVARSHQIVTAVGIRSTSTTAPGIMKTVQDMMSTADTYFGGFAAFVLAAIFGGDAGAAFSQATSGGGDLGDGAAAVGGAVVTAVFGGLDLNGGGALEPGVERAEAYLGSVTEMVMRGFLLDIACRVVPWWNLSFVQDLQQNLIGALGLGRVARTVLRPIVTTLVADPALWAVNLAYRPKLITEADAVKLWELGEFDDARLDDELGRQGWSSDRIEGFKSLHLKPADFGAMTVLLDNGVSSDDDVVNSLLHQGFLATAADHKLQAHKLSRAEPWLVKQADVWLAKYEEGLIDLATFTGGVRTTGLPADVQQLIVNIGGARRETSRKLLSVGELFTCWKNNILTQNDVHDYLVRLGYDETDATSLLLTQLAIGNHAAEVAQQKKDAIAARAAAVAAAKAERAAEQQAKQLAAAAARLAKQQTAAAAKAQSLQDAETLRKFVSDSAAARRAIVDQQHQAGTIAKDQADALKADIAANEAALLAAATAQAKDADVAFDQQILELKTSAQMEDYDAQLADVDLSLEEDAQARSAAVAVRLSTVDQLLQLAFSDVDDLFAQRSANAADDLAASLAAVDVAVLPTETERQASADTQIAALGDALTRKLSDIADHYAQLQQTVDDELAAGTITAKSAAASHDRLTNAQAQAERLASQQHDLSVQRLQDVAATIVPLDAAKAATTKLSIQTAAAKAAKTLAADKLKAENAAQHTADAEKIRLQAIGAQTAPVSAAAAAKKKATINTAIAKLQASQAVSAATIQKQAADAAAAIGKAQTAVQAAKQREQLLTSTAAQRESAAATAAAQLQTFDEQTAASKDAIEATILQHRIGTPPA